MKFKKRINGSWTDIPYYINTTMTDSLTILPATLYTDNSEIVVGVKGDAIQSNIPTPESPVIPQGTGDNTGNLFDISTAVLGKWINSAGEEKTSSVQTPQYRLNHTDYISVEPNTEYTFSYNGDYSTSTTVAMCWFDNNKEIVAKSDYPTSGQKVYSFSATAPNDARYCIVNFTGYNGIGKSDMIFTAGSIVPSYEPFGYKVTVSCGDTLIPVYLGEVQSTRKIKKLVLTGEENFVYDSNYTRFRFTIPNSLILGVRRTPIICSHYEAITDGRPIEDVPKNTIYSDSATLNRWWIEAEDFTSANDFKAYLAAQYATGTPVTIWYILTTEETGIVNEPLMKIGDYADEIINISIPTIVGTNTFNIDTVVQPSEVTLHYHGWHPITNVHEHNNGAWN